MALSTSNGACTDVATGLAVRSNHKVCWPLPVCNLARPSTVDLQIAKAVDCFTRIEGRATIVLKLGDLSLAGILDRRPGNKYFAGEERISGLLPSGLDSYHPLADWRHDAELNPIPIGAYSPQSCFHGAFRSTTVPGV